MKPFDLEAAKRGEPIQTSDGRPAKFIAHVPDAHKDSRLVIQIGGSVYLYHEEGKLTDFGSGKHCDLFMTPRKRTVWVNLYEDGIARWHYTETTADSFPKLRIENRAFPLEIEE
jgi:hypothetical protein